MYQKFSTGARFELVSRVLFGCQIYNDEMMGRRKKGTILGTLTESKTKFGNSARNFGRRWGGERLAWKQAWLVVWWKIVCQTTEEFFRALARRKNCCAGTDIKTFFPKAVPLFDLEILEIKSTCKISTHKSSAADLTTTEVYRRVGGFRSREKQSLKRKNNILALFEAELCTNKL